MLSKLFNFLCFLGVDMEERFEDTTKFFVYIARKIRAGSKAQYAYLNENVNILPRNKSFRKCSSLVRLSPYKLCYCPKTMRPHS